ncbi:MAG: DoxX family protein [Paludibacteraceae bacterium]|nr:DoxX family protein [Paludibacteraceae bacterium]MBP5136083.1 DoxX family protein [Paludibacteraceae bacterium]
MESVKRIVFLISKFIVGAVFTFSGFVKIIDPWGTTYKIQDYLEAMGEFFMNFSSFAFIASVALATIELVVGVNLLIGIRVRQNAFVAALLMLLMTPLTLWIAIENPVHDCGCFGDAIVLDNWTTFWKNVVLIALIVLIFAFLKTYRCRLTKTCQWIIEGFTVLFAIGLAGYCYCSLPIVDFRPYHIGADIRKGMEIPDDAEQDVYDTKLIYEKNGEQKEFTIDNYPANDSTWHFVDQKSVLVKQGYVPPIHDFTIDTEDDGDVTEEFLEDKGYSFLVISYDLSMVNFTDMKREKLVALNSYALKNGYNMYLLTASVEEDIQKFRETVSPDIVIGLTDKITLKTIIRYNPGVVLVKDGVVINKWPLPDMPEFNTPLEKSKYGIVAPTHERRDVIIALLIWLIPVLLLSVMDLKLNRGRD